VAEHRPVHREDRGEPDAVAAQQRMADRVDPAVHAMEPPGPQSPPHAVPREPETLELAHGDDAVLPACEVGHRRVDGMKSTKGAHIACFVDFARHDEGSWRGTCDGETARSQRNAAGTVPPC
jgi:hypothetical protein